MKKIFKNCTIIIVTITMIASLMCNGVMAKDAKDNNKEKLPEKFDLRDKIEIKVEDQGVRGTCWTFAALNTLETYLSLHGYGDYDFSEMHLECMENGFNEESKYIGDIPENDGGWYGYFISYCEREKGPVLESEIPYYKNNEYGKYYTEEDYELFKNVKPSAYAYGFKKYDIDCYDNADEFYSDVKNHIMKNGGLYAHINTYEINQLDDGNVNYFYTYPEGESAEVEETNHGITIIGWDDNYDKNNFSEWYKPKNNGAYIAMNSYGESFGNNGIFYISYEDYWVNRTMYGVVDASTEHDASKSKYQVVEIKIDDKEIYNSLKKQLNIEPEFEEDRESYGINKNFDDENQTIYMYNHQLQEIDQLDFSGVKFDNLNGIENFTSCDKFSFCNCGLKDLSSLKNIEKMATVLDLSENDIEDLSELPNFKKLFFLILSYNKNLKNLSTICELKGLKSLELAHCGLEDISSLRKLKMLDESWLDLSGNNIKDFSVLENSNISALFASGNKTIEKIGKLTNLNTIYLDSCNLEDLSIIEELDLDKVSVLSASYNKIKNIDTVKKIKNLNYLDLSFQEVIENINLNSEKYKFPSIISDADLYDQLSFYGETRETKSNTMKVAVSEDGDYVIFSEANGDVIFKVDGGVCNGTKYKINYNISKESKNKDDVKEESKVENQNKPENNIDIKEENKDNVKDTEIVEQKGEKKITENKVIENKKNESKNTNLSNPKTGDNVIVIASMIGISVLIIIVTFIVNKKKIKRMEE